MSNRCCSLYPTKRSHNTVIPSSLSPVLCYTLRPVPCWVVGWVGCDARPVINVSMSSGKQANEKSLSQAYPDPNRVSGGATSYEIKLITPPCEGVINNPRAPNIAPPELTDWGALHQPRRDLSLWTDSRATITGDTLYKSRSYQQCCMCVTFRSHWNGTTHSSLLFIVNCGVLELQ